MALSLQIGSLDRLSPEDQQRQLVELFDSLETYLNRQVTVYVRDDATKPYPNFKRGDILFDLVTAPSSLALFEYNGKALIPLTVDSLVGGISFDDITGLLDLVARGTGSGTNASFYLRSDGAEGWVLAPIPLPTQLVVPFEAIVDLSAYDVVTIAGDLADSSNLGHYGRVIGVVLGDTATGFIGEALLEGEITNPAWTWTPGQNLFLNGTVLSLSPPSTGFSQKIAVARNDEIIVVQPKHPVLL